VASAKEASPVRATGIVRRLDRLGRIVIPKEVRTALGLARDVGFSFGVDGDRLVLSRYEPGCIFCGAPASLEHAGRRVCHPCARALGTTSAQQLGSPDGF
jgi:transcriptional pleiotropic regulator of transition state genes